MEITINGMPASLTLTNDAIEFDGGTFDTDDAIFTTYEVAFGDYNGDWAEATATDAAGNTYLLRWDGSSPVCRTDDNSNEAVWRVASATTPDWVWRIPAADPADTDEDADDATPRTRFQQYVHYNPNHTDESEANGEDANDANYAPADGSEFVVGGRKFRVDRRGVPIYVIRVADD